MSFGRFPEIELFIQNPKTGGDSIETNALHALINLSQLFDKTMAQMQIAQTMEDVKSIMTVAKMEVDMIHSAYQNAIGKENKDAETSGN